MSQPQKKTRKFAGRIFLTLLFSAVVFMFFAQGRIDIRLFGPNRILQSREEANKAKCVLEFSAGDQNLLIKFAIPCEDPSQWDEVTSKMARVKHECLMALYRPEMVEFIRQRNFEALRKVLVRTLNGVITHEVETIYFENISSY